MRNSRLSKFRRKKAKKFILPMFFIFAVLGVCTFYFFSGGNLNNSALASIKPKAKAPVRETSTTPIKKEKEYTISSVGNLLAHEKQIDGAKDGSTYNFDNSFKYIDDYIKPSDMAVGVVEGSFKGGTPSGYPLFNIPDDFLTSLKTSGFDVINLSTNHIIDHGVSGFNRSLDIVDEKDLTALGVRDDVNDPNYTIYEIDGHKVGMFAYTYKTQGENINGIPIPDQLKPLVNSFNYQKLDLMYSQIDTMLKSMKAEGVEFTIASFHWGEEYITSENNSQREIANKMNEMGIDIVLGNHPHVVQPYEVINKNGKSTFVSYGQGNILSNQCYEELGNRLTEDGTLIQFKLGVNKEDDLYLKGYEVIPTWVHRYQREDSLYNHVIIPVQDALKSPDKFDLSSEYLNRAKQSLKDTTSIIGAENLGYKEFK